MAVLLILVFVFPFAATGEESSLCKENVSQLNDESKLMTVVDDAIAKNHETVHLTYIATSDVVESDVSLARKNALSSAFEYVILLVVKRLLVKENNTALIESFKAGYKKKTERVYVRSFQTKKSEICEKNFILPIDMEISLVLLKKNLHELNATPNHLAWIHIENIQNATQYKKLRDLVCKALEPNQRCVERYQKKGEVQLWVDTPLDADGVMVQLKSIPVTDIKYEIEKSDSGRIHLKIMEK